MTLTELGLVFDISVLSRPFIRVQNRTLLVLLRILLEAMNLALYPP